MNWDNVIAETLKRVDLIGEKAVEGTKYIVPKIGMFLVGKAVGELLGIIVFFGIFTYAVHWSITTYEVRREKPGHLEDVNQIVGILSGVGIVIAMVLLITMLPEIIATIISPEAAALKAIVGK